jgi:hypothetical protein
VYTSLKFRLLSFPPNIELSKKYLPGTNTLAYQDNNIEKVCKVDFRLNIAIKGTINNIARAEPFVLISIFTGLWMAPRHSAERHRLLTPKKRTTWLILFCRVPSCSVSFSCILLCLWSIMLLSVILQRVILLSIVLQSGILSFFLVSFTELSFFFVSLSWVSFCWKSWRHENSYFLPLPTNMQIPIPLNCFVFVPVRNVDYKSVHGQSCIFSEFK